MHARIAIAVVGLLVVAGCDSADEMLSPDDRGLEPQAGHVADRAPTRSYEITITNLTDGGQPLTPPVVAVHRRAEDVFTVGKAASHELQQLAENGAVPVMAGALGDSRHVSGVGVGLTTPPVPPLEAGETVTLELTAEPGSRFVSFVSMLICTNDGFTGVDGAHLPNKVGETWTGTTDAYDAGTEINTEDFVDMVPPCQVLGGKATDDAGTGATNPALAENGVVHHHPGIQGIADLEAGIHGWSNPVAEVSVTRTN